SSSPALRDSGRALRADALQVLADQAPIGLGVDLRTDQLRGRGNRKLDCLATHLLDGTLALTHDLRLRPLHQLLLLLARLVQQLLAHPLRRLLPLRDHLLRIRARLRKLLTLLRQQLLGLLTLRTRLVELLLDPLLARRGIPENRRERELQQHAE